MLVFSGTVDFGPQRVLVPGPQGFPPKQSSGGAVGDARYSPLVATGNGVVLNATQVANNTGRSDTVRSIDYRRRQVTLGLLAGFVDGQRNLHLHTDASAQPLAGIEDSTYAPNSPSAPSPHQAPGRQQVPPRAVCPRHSGLTMHPGRAHLRTRGPFLVLWPDQRCGRGLDTWCGQVSLILEAGLLEPQRASVL